MKIRVTIILFLILAGFHLAILDDYGITWDFHHIFFAGLRLINIPLTTDLVENIPFGRPSPWDMYNVPFGQLMTLFPILGYQFFFSYLGIIPFDSAFHLSTLILGLGGIAAVGIFLWRIWNPTAAIWSMIFLTLMPRYFGDLHNNVKDVPQAVFFTIAIFLFYLLYSKKSVKYLLLASPAFAVAFNFKVNALFIPIICFVWIFFLSLSKHKTGRIVYLYFIAAPIAALLLWSLLWNDPIKQLLYIPEFFGFNTKNLEVLYFGKWYCSTINVPWHYPFGYLAVTTPIPVLVFFLIGLIRLISLIRSRPIASLLLIWFFLPLMRYILPSVGVIDGIRHFEEAVLPMVIIAGIGASVIFSSVKKLPLYIALTGLAILPTIVSIVRLHPYQITYFNELIGGLAGAYGSFDLDYWGSSQKQAVFWLNRTAPAKAKVNIVMAADVAAKYLRKDLLAQLNKTDAQDADYVILLNRQSFFYRYSIVEYLLTHKPIYTIERYGVPLVWIFDNHTGATPRQNEWWNGQSPCVGSNLQRE